MLLRFFLLLFFCCSLITITFGQVGNSASSRFVDRAIKAYAKKDIKNAEKFFKKAISLSPNAVNVYAAAGQFYLTQNRFSDAAYIYEVAAYKCKNGSQFFAIPLANALYRAGNYEKANTILRAYHRPASASASLKHEIEALQKNIDFGRVSSYNKYAVQPENLGDSINSKYDDYFPSVNVTEDDIVFTRRNNDMDDDFFQTKKDSCGIWSRSKDLGFPLNSANPECSQIRSVSNHYMIYQKCDNRSVNGWERGGCDLYLSYKMGDKWSAPKPFGFTINTTAFEGMPSLSANDSVLYFVSDREGGYGGKDIWVTEFKNGLWQKPQNLGATINTDKDDTAPFIAADNKTLYFSSAGHPGFGGADLFVSKLENGVWKKPQNLGIPINSTYDEVSASVSMNGKTLYYASNRPGGYGKMDLYKVQLPENLQAQAQRLIYGTVLDSLNNEEIKNADIYISNAETDQSLMQLKSNKGNGSFCTVLPAETSVAFTIGKSGYQTFTDTIQRPAPKVYTDTVVMKLLPEGYEPNLKDTILITLDMNDSAIMLEDQYCLLINSALIPFSGKIISVTINSFIDDYNTPSQDVFSPPVLDCLYKIGLTSQHVTVHRWDAADPTLTNTVFKNGKVQLILKYQQ